MGEVLEVDALLGQVKVDLDEKKDHRISIDAVDSILELIPDESFRGMSYKSSEELARLGELVKTAVGFDTTRVDSGSVDSMRFMDYSMDLGDPIDKSIGDELTENVVSIVRGVLALLVVGLILVFGVRPMLRKFSEGDQLNSYEDPALTAEKAAEPAALTAEGQRPKLPGTTPAVADIGEDDDPLPVTDDDIEAAEVAEYVRMEGIRGNLH